MSSNGGFPPLKYIVKDETDEKKIQKERSSNKSFEKNNININNILMSIKKKYKMIEEKQEIKVIDTL
jgi:hypothetical protein